MKEFIKSFTIIFLIPVMVGASLLFSSYQNFKANAEKNDDFSAYSEETITLINEIENEYSLNIHIGQDPNDLENSMMKRIGLDNEFQFHNLTINEDYLYDFLTEFKRVLGSYDKEDLEEVPSEIFLTNGFYKVNEYNMIDFSAVGLTVAVSNSMKSIPLYLIFDIEKGGLSYEHIIEHEFMHCFATKFSSETKQKIKDLNLNCSYISDYACTNDDELIAEAYAERFISRELIGKN